MINSCERDQAFPQEAQAIADAIFGEGKFAPGYERTYWPDCDHGFAVLGDIVRCLDYVACHHISERSIPSEQPCCEGGQRGFLQGGS